MSGLPSLWHIYEPKINSRKKLLLEAEDANKNQCSMSLLRRSNWERSNKYSINKNDEESQAEKSLNQKNSNIFHHRVCSLQLLTF